jgi:DNA-binding protein Fis
MLSGRPVEVHVDPLQLSLEELLYRRLGTFLDQLDGRRLPDLYRVVVDQLDRALLRQALERSDDQLVHAAAFLGLDRNTLARKAKRLRLGNATRPLAAKRKAAK